MKVSVSTYLEGRYCGGRIGASCRFALGTTGRRIPARGEGENASCFWAEFGVGTMTGQEARAGEKDDLNKGGGKRDLSTEHRV